MLQHYCAWRCTLFWLIPHIQIQYGPLSLHVANTFCICSPLAGHILLSGSFWCLLPGLELLQVVSLFLLSNYLTTICWWWLCLHEASLGSEVKTIGCLAMQCFVFPLFFFHWLHLGLKHVFQGFSIFRGRFIFSVLNFWHCYFPFEFSSILGYWIFGFRSFMIKHLLWILPFFVLQVLLLLLLLFVNLHRKGRSGK